MIENDIEIVWPKNIVSNEEIDNPDVKWLEWEENDKMFFWYNIPYELSKQPSTTISIGYYEK